MANNRLELCESTSALMRCSWQKSGYIKDKSGLNSKIHLAVNEHMMFVKFITADWSCADCKEKLLT